MSAAVLDLYDDAAPPGAAGDRPHAVAPECPRCCQSPLRFSPSGDCRDSTGGGVYGCDACGWSTARDRLVAELLRRLRETEDLMLEFTQLALPILSACARGAPPAATDPRLAFLRELLHDLHGEEPDRVPET